MAGEATHGGRSRSVDDVAGVDDGGTCGRPRPRGGMGMSATPDYHLYPIITCSTASQGNSGKKSFGESEYFAFWVVLTIMGALMNKGFQCLEQKPTALLAFKRIDQLQSLL